MIAKEKPLFELVSGSILSQIEKREYNVGFKLPSEEQFRNKYKVSRHTVREALRKLEGEGYIYKIQGKGAFLAKKKVSYNVSKKTQFSTSVLDTGLATSSRLLGITSIYADEKSELREKLEINIKQKVWALEIIRYINDIPFIYSISYLPERRFKGLNKHINGKSFSLYKLLREKYSVSNITRTSSVFEVGIPEREDISALQISKSIPLMIVKSRAKDSNETVVEYCVSRFRGDMASLEVTF
jgi:DNA-binding GntR family transcriptional regulator